MEGSQSDIFEILQALQSTLQSCQSSLCYYLIDPTQAEVAHTFKEGIYYLRQHLEKLKMSNWDQLYKQQVQTRQVQDKLSKKGNSIKKDKQMLLKLQEEQSRAFNCAEFDRASNSIGQSKMLIYVTKQKLEMLYDEFKRDYYKRESKNLSEFKMESPKLLNLEHERKNFSVAVQTFREQIRDIFAMQADFKEMTKQWLQLVEIMTNTTQNSYKLIQKYDQEQYGNSYNESKNFQPSINGGIKLSKQNNKVSPNLSKQQSQEESKEIKIQQSIKGMEQEEMIQAKELQKKQKQGFVQRIKNKLGFNGAQENAKYSQKQEQMPFTPKEPNLPIQEKIAQAQQPQIQQKSQQCEKSCEAFKAQVNLTKNNQEKDKVNKRKKQRQSKKQEKELEMIDPQDFQINPQEQTQKISIQEKKAKKCFEEAEEEQKQPAKPFVYEPKQLEMEPQNYVNFSSDLNKRGDKVDQIQLLGYTKLIQLDDELALVQDASFNIVLFDFKNGSIFTKLNLYDSQAQLFCALLENNILYLGTEGSIQMHQRIYNYEFAAIGEIKLGNSDRIPLCMMRWKEECFVVGMKGENKILIVNERLKIVQKEIEIVKQPNQRGNQYYYYQPQAKINAYQMIELQGTRDVVLASSAGLHFYNSSDSNFSKIIQCLKDLCIIQIAEICPNYFVLCVERDKHYIKIFESSTQKLTNILNPSQDIDIKAMVPLWTPSSPQLSHILVRHYREATIVNLHTKKTRVLAYNEYTEAFLAAMVCYYEQSQGVHKLTYLTKKRVQDLTSTITIGQTIPLN